MPWWYKEPGHQEAWLTYVAWNIPLRYTLVYVMARCWPSTKPWLEPMMTKILPYAQGKIKMLKLKYFVIHWLIFLFFLPSRCVLLSGFLLSSTKPALSSSSSTPLWLPSHQALDLPRSQNQVISSHKNHQLYWRTTTQTHMVQCWKIAFRRRHSYSDRTSKDITQRPSIIMIRRRRSCCLRLGHRNPGKVCDICTGRRCLDIITSASMAGENSNFM